MERETITDRDVVAACALAKQLHQGHSIDEGDMELARDRVRATASHAALAGMADAFLGLINAAIDLGRR